MPLLTVLTPTYNRCKLLNNLYLSLTKQTSQNFTWLIVDDGSTDDTKKVVSLFQEKANFEINYIYKENGGKHTALNKGIKEINSELTIIVDSDDCLLPNAIYDIEVMYQKYIDRNDISTFTFLRCYTSGKPIVSLDKDEFVANYIKYRIKQNRPGDMAEVFKTEILKKYPFPEFEHERFVSEDVVWIEIGKKFDSVFINKAIYECEYLENGLTANDKPMKFASPLGSMLRGKQLMSKECGIRANIKGAIIYNCYKRCLNRNSTIPSLLKCSVYEKFFKILFTPISVFFYAKWRNGK